MPGGEARACCCSASRGWTLPGCRDSQCHRSATPGGSGQPLGAARGWRRRHLAAGTAVGGSRSLSLGSLLPCWGCPLPHGRGSADPSPPLMSPRAVPHLTQRSPFTTSIPPWAVPHLGQHNPFTTTPDSPGALLHLGQRSPLNTTPDLPSGSPSPGTAQPSHHS